MVMVRTMLESLRPYAESLHIDSPRSFRVLGRSFSLDAPVAPDADRGAESVAAPAAAAVAATALEPAALAQLASLLYLGCHGGQPVHLGDRISPMKDRALERDFAAQLSIANTGQGPMHRGYVVRDVDTDGRYVVQRASLELWATRAELEREAEPGIVCTGDVTIATGTRVRVRFPKEFRSYSPGHYVALGDADRGVRDNPVRLYWHLTAEGAEPLVREICHRFNAAGVGFMLKVLVNPGGYTRADAGILYLPRHALAEGLSLVRPVYDALLPLLRTPMSAFVLPMAPGLGLAEDPADGSSFGRQRSALLAPLLCEAAGAADPLAVVTRRLRELGYDPDRFWLNPGSTHHYETFSTDAS